MKFFLAIAAAVMTAFLTTTDARAATVRMGTLQCHIDGNAGFIVGSHTGLTCVLRRLNGVREYYHGSITKIGVDVGFTADTELVWLVFAPSLQIEPGALEGRYWGVSAEATAGVGIGANVLIGGFDRSINLQPISVQGQTGVDIAAGVAGMRLIHSQPEPAFPVKR